MGDILAVEIEESFEGVCRNLVRVDLLHAFPLALEHIENGF